MKSLGNHVVDAEYVPSGSTRPYAAVWLINALTRLSRLVLGMQTYGKETDAP